MTSDAWRALGLEPARPHDFDDLSGLELQPSPWNVVSIQASGENQARRLQTLEDWRAQSPVERIVNTILLCALRDGARQITIDPQAHGVHVRFTTTDEVRDHIRLPMFTLSPIVEQFKRMAQLDTNLVEEQQGLLKLRINMAQLDTTLIGMHQGHLKLRNDQEYDLQISTHPTPWGERVELRFAS